MSSTLVPVRTVVTITPTSPAQPGDYRVIVNDGNGILTPYTGPNARTLDLGSSGRFQVESLTGGYEVQIIKTYSATGFTDSSAIRFVETNGRGYASTLAVAPTPGVTQPPNAGYSVAYVSLDGSTQTLSGSNADQVTTRTPVLFPAETAAVITVLTGTYDFTTSIVGVFGPDNLFPLAPESKPDTIINGGGETNRLWIWFVLVLIIVGVIWALMSVATSSYRPSPRGAPRIVIPVTTV